MPFSCASSLLSESLNRLSHSFWFRLGRQKRLRAFITELPLRIHLPFIACDVIRLRTPVLAHLGRVRVNPTQSRRQRPKHPCNVDPTHSRENFVPCALPTYLSFHLNNFPTEMKPTKKKARLILGKIPKLLHRHDIACALFPPFGSRAPQLKFPRYPPENRTCLLHSFMHLSM